MRTRFGAFTLDSESRQLFRDGGEVHLSPKAFDLLCTLIARRPGVVTKQDLFARIWPDTFVSEANLNVLVAEVRRAIEDDTRSPLFIRTAHGVGYAFSGEAADLERAESSGVARPTHFWLEEKGHIHALDAGEHIIGRDPRSDVWLNDASVSRRHARIRIAGAPGRATLEDLDSMNGTFVGRQRINQPTTLADGTRIKIGSVALRFHEGTKALADTRRVRRGAR